MLYACDMTLFFYAGKAIVFCGDGRCDSPGSSAKLCSYTLMDVKTNAIMHMETVTCEQVSCCFFCCFFMKLYSLPEALDFYYSGP